MNRRQITRYIRNLRLEWFDKQHAYTTEQLDAIENEANTWEMYLNVMRKLIE